MRAAAVSILLMLGTLTATPTVGETPSQPTPENPGLKQQAEFSSSTKAVLSPTGSFITGTGIGFEGADVSHLQDRDLGFGTWGFPNTRAEGSRTADDFVVPSGEIWQIETITFYAYQNILTDMKAATSTINHVNLRIWDGRPDQATSNVVWGDTSTNRLLSSSWTNVYRVSQYDESLHNRPIMAVICNVGVTLPAGTYWLDWQTGGSSIYAGPFAPPITILGQPSTGNGLILFNGMWSEAYDYEMYSNNFARQQGFPIQIEGIKEDSTAPSELHVRNSDQTQIWFYCEDSTKPSLPVGEDAFPTWRHVTWGADGYHHQLFRGTSCGATPDADSVWEAPSGDDYYSFQIPSPSAGSYCWRVRGWYTGPWSGGYFVGDWSDCCCFEVGGQPPEQLPTPVMEGVDDRPCGSSTSNTTPLLRWSDIAHDDGYRWQVRDASQNLVDSGTSGTNVNVALVDTLIPGDYAARVQARGDGVSSSDSEWSADCPFTVEGTVEEAVDFTWWPEQPKQGERVRFADLSSPRPLTWSWNFSDGSLSNEQHPSHVFPSTGQFSVILEAEFASGFEHIQKALTVSGVVQCGDDACDSGETAWSCPSDCGLLPEETGRAGGSDRRPTVPAVAGAVAGVGGDLWNTEAWLYNSAGESATIVFEFTPRDQTSVFSAGPLEIPANRGMYWSNIVEDLFQSSGSGALWVDSTSPVLFVTRTYNTTEKGTYGQGFSGIREKLTLGAADGEVYLIGLRDDDQFRTNLYVQEVDGASVKLKVGLWDPLGQSLRTKNLVLEGHSYVQRNLGDMFSVEVPSGYVTAEVTDGDGRVAIAASIIDNITGDPTSVDATHDDMISKSTASEDHNLVPAITHTTGSLGSVWRSNLTIFNYPNNPRTTIRLVYRPEYDRTGDVGNFLETSIILGPGEQISWNDVLPDLFDLPARSKTQGSLHVYATDAVRIDSRTYNEAAAAGTYGLGIPALQSAEMIGSGKTRTMIGLQNTDETRTNIGLAEFSGQDTTVEISFFSVTQYSDHYLGLVGPMTVPANSHLQIVRIFDQLPKAADQELDNVVAHVTVVGEGSVYAYATVIDNRTGDATKYIAAE